MNFNGGQGFGTGGSSNTGPLYVDGDLTVTGKEFMSNKTQGYGFTADSDMGMSYTATGIGGQAGMTWGDSKGGFSIQKGTNNQYASGTLNVTGGLVCTGAATASSVTTTTQPFAVYYGSYSGSQNSGINVDFSSALVKQIGNVGLTWNTTSLAFTTTVAGFYEVKYNATITSGVAGGIQNAITLTLNNNVHPIKESGLSSTSTVDYNYYVAQTDYLMAGQTIQFGIVCNTSGSGTFNYNAGASIMRF